MVVSIARQSVILKCMRKKSVMVGNYEFYYSAGLVENLYKIGCTSDMGPVELFEYISSRIESVSPGNPEEEYLLKMIARYEPQADYDDQMVELFKMGEAEKNYWQVNLY